LVFVVIYDLILRNHKCRQTLFNILSHFLWSCEPHNLTNSGITIPFLALCSQSVFYNARIDINVFIQTILSVCNGKADVKYRSQQVVKMSL
jgi:hypothetical protein